MSNHKERVFWILYGMVLVLLFLLSSTDLIIKEKKAQIYAISVIVEDTVDDNYVNFRKGMDRAAIEYNVDVSFITLYDEGSREQQEELILREQQDGSRNTFPENHIGPALSGLHERQCRGDYEGQKKGCGQ